MVAKVVHHFSIDTVEAVRCDLLPLASVVTPNLPEAGVLGLPAAKTRAEMSSQARNSYHMVLMPC